MRVDNVWLSELLYLSQRSQVKQSAAIDSVSQLSLQLSFLLFTQISLSVYIPVPKYVYPCPAIPISERRTHSTTDICQCHVERFLES